MKYTAPPNRQEYYQQTWELARQIPQGKLATYGQLGQMLAPPEAFDPVDYKVFNPRWVGESMAACPDDVPWHRVVNSQGKISQWVNADEQKQRLEKEGHYLVNAKLDLKFHQWGGFDEGSLPEQGRCFSCPILKCKFFRLNLAVGALTATLRGDALTAVFSQLFAVRLR